MVLAAHGRLDLLRASGQIQPFAPGYRSPGGEEPYIALSPGACFGRDTIYALELARPHRVLRISASGRVSAFATVGASGLEDGITFDRTGRFARRLLVTVNAGAKTSIVSIDCHGRVRTVTGSAPRLEGGIAVAPAGFGRFGGDLVAPDELTGLIYAITPGGRTLQVASSSLPHGQDVGVESEGFVPGGHRFEALLSDRLTPGNRHPGDDVLLGLSSAVLRRRGVRAGELLVATEGGAGVEAIRCSARGCQVRHVADGPPIAHAEGHIAFWPR
jgi:hypothetical protein